MTDIYQELINRDVIDLYLRTNETYNEDGDNKYEIECTLCINAVGTNICIARSITTIDDNRNTLAMRDIRFQLLENIRQKFIKKLDDIICEEKAYIEIITERSTK